MTVIDRIMSFEDGTLSADETVELFSDLIKSGMLPALQGSYGRMASQLIERGYLTSDGDILKYFQGDN